MRKNENYQLGDYSLIQHQILRTNIMRIVQQEVENLGSERVNDSNKTKKKKLRSINLLWSWKLGKNKFTVLLSSHICSLHPTVNGFHILLLSVVKTTKVSVRINMLVFIHSLVHFNSLFKDFFSWWAINSWWYLFQVPKVSQS